MPDVQRTARGLRIHFTGEEIAATRNAPPGSFWRRVFSFEDDSMCDEARIKTGPAEDPRLRGPFASGGESFGRLADRNQMTDSPRRPSYREMLLKERHALAERQARVDHALLMLDANPGFEQHQQTRDALKAAGIYFD